MKKMIRNLHEYLDCRVVLNDDFFARSARNDRYSLRAYSRDLGVSSGYLSDVLKGKKRITASKGRAIFARIGFSGEELQYVESLILLKSEDEFERARAYEFVRRRNVRPLFKTDPERDLVLKSVDHFLIYGLVRKVPRLAALHSFTDLLEISRERVIEVLGELSAEGYVVQREGEASVTDKALIITRHERIFSLHDEFSKFLIEIVRKRGGPNEDDAILSGLVFALDQASFDVAKQMQEHFVKTLYRLEHQSKQIDRVILAANLFVTVDPTP